jgi:hypothetical protein
VNLPDLLLLQAAATWFMTGVIWIIQIVHYPLFAGVGPDRYAAYQHRHMRRITAIVAPAMFVEAATALAAALWPPPGVPALATWAGLLLVVLLWLSTALLQVPAHRRLTQGFDPAAHRRLVATNWLRTTLWTTRALLLLSLLHPTP